MNHSLSLCSIAKTGLLFIILLTGNCTLHQRLHAQETNLSTSAAEKPAFTRNEHFLVTRFGAGFGASQEPLFTTLRYEGPCASGGVEYRGYAEKFFLNVRGDANLGFFEADPAVNLGPGRQTGVHILGSVIGAYQILSDADSRLYAGLLAQIFWHLKSQNGFGNNGSVRDSYLNGGIMLRGEQDFSLLNKLFRGSVQLHLPIAGIASRPAYGLADRYPITVRNPGGMDLFGSETETVSLFKFPFVQFRTSLEYMLSQGNYLGLNYDWDYYSYSAITKAQSGRHGFSLSFLFRF